MVLFYSVHLHYKGHWPFPQNICEILWSVGERKNKIIIPMETPCSIRSHAGSGTPCKPLTHRLPPCTQCPHISPKLFLQPSSLYTYPQFWLELCALPVAKPDARTPAGLETMHDQSTRTPAPNSGRYLLFCHRPLGQKTKQETKTNEQSTHLTKTKLRTQNLDL